MFPKQDKSLLPTNAKFAMQIFLQYQLRGFHCVHLKLPAKILVMMQNEQRKQLQIPSDVTGKKGAEKLAAIEK
jgi:hypothetical protein